MRSLRDTDRASSRGSLLLVVWLVEREVRPAVVVVVVVMTVVEEEESREDPPEERIGEIMVGDDKVGPKGLWIIFIFEVVVVPKVVVSDGNDRVIMVVVPVVTVESVVHTSGVNEGSTFDMVVDDMGE